MTRLRLLVIVPSLLLLGGLFFHVVEHERANDLLVTKAIMAKAADSIDDELSVLADELALFARLPSVQSGDLARVTEDAAQLSLHLRGWLMLVKNGPDPRDLLDPRQIALEPSRQGGDAGLQETTDDSANVSAVDPSPVTVSDAIYSDGLAMSVVTLTEPLRSGPLKDHRLVLHVSVARLAQKLLTLDLPPGGEAMLIDGAGQIIGSTNDVAHPEVMAVSGGLATALAIGDQGSIVGEIDGVSPSQSVTAWQRLSNAPGWTVVVTLPEGQPGVALGEVVVMDGFTVLGALLLLGLYVATEYRLRRADLRSQAQAQEIDRLEQDAQSLREADALRDEQLSMLYHDMRSSLMGTKDVIQGLLLTSRDRTQTFHLNSALASTGRLLRMFEDSQTSAPDGKPKPLSRLEPFSPHALLASLAPLIEGRAQRNGTVLSVDLATNMPWLSGDSVQIGQIVLNLLGNAAKFTKNGVVSLAGRVEPMPETRSRGRLVVTVTDTGPGIAPDDLSQIFTARFRAARSMEQSIEGSGLGLAIVKRMVDAMQGSITVTSVVGEGSQFTLTLPLDLARPAKSRSAKSKADLLSGKRVLLVDDDPMMLLAGSNLLQGAGAEVSLASTLEDTLAACRDALPDALVLDLNIPGVDVPELVRTIRDMPTLGQRPIIAFSASMTAERASDCRNMGFDAAIQKDADLPATLASVLPAA
ncbi:MAG: ATP-binding protein [Paracoccaceae bacterium]